MRTELQKYLKKLDSSEDRQILEWLRPLAKKLEIPVEELCLNLHSQDIFKFDNIDNLLCIKYLEE